MLVWVRTSGLRRGGLSQMFQKPSRLSMFRNPSGPVLHIWLFLYFGGPSCGCPKNKSVFVWKLPFHPIRVQVPIYSVSIWGLIMMVGHTAPLFEALDPLHHFAEPLLFFKGEVGGSTVLRRFCG